MASESVINIVKQITCRRFTSRAFFRKIPASRVDSALTTMIPLGRAFALSANLFCLYHSNCTHDAWKRVDCVRFFKKSARMFASVSISSGQVHATHHESKINFTNELCITFPPVARSIRCPFGDPSLK